MGITETAAATLPGTPADTGAGRPGEPRRTLWTTITGALGAVMGLAPHVLHHVGPLMGTALVAGAGGTVLFGGLGLAASVPMLITLKRRFASWWAPTIALVVFALMFSISTFVVGPRISGAADPAPTNPTSTETSPTPGAVEHDAHH